MPSLRPPNRLEPTNFPVFCMSWFADPSTGQSIYAYGGGGGSARTGIFNSVVVQNGADVDSVKISTGDQVAVALRIYSSNAAAHTNTDRYGTHTANQHSSDGRPDSQQPSAPQPVVWMVVALGGDVRRFSVPQGDLDGVLSVVVNPSIDDPNHTDGNSHGSTAAEKDSCEALGVNRTTDQLAVGCNSGFIKIYSISDDVFANAPVLFVCEGHTKCICSLSFSVRGGKLLSSSKDGTARVWDCVQTGQSIAEMACSCDDPTANDKKQKRRGPSATQTIVKGCAFADLDGAVAVLVASTRRGDGFIFQWIQKERGGEYALDKRTKCSVRPISAMSLSHDGGLLAIGNTEGTISLWSVREWAVLKTFQEVHQLPVTCIAARPYEVDLQGEEFYGVRVHARSASGDSQMGCLTLQKTATRKHRHNHSLGGGNSFLSLALIHRLLLTSLCVWVLSPVAREAVDKCDHTWKRNDWSALPRCLWDEVVIAPSSRAGVRSPPY